MASVLVLACRPTGTVSPDPQAPAPAVQSAALQPSQAHDDDPVASEARDQASSYVHPPWRKEDEARIRKYQPMVAVAARRHHVDPHVLNAIIWHESRFHPEAQGPGGAAGLMQLMPRTSRDLAKKLGRWHRPLDPEFSVEAGAYLMHRLLVKFDGDLDLALAGYAIGSGGVRKRLEAGEPMPERTQRFVTKVKRWRQAFAHADFADRGAAQ